MATKIVTKNSSTAGSAPSASDLVQGELAVNVVDKRLYTEDNAGNIVELGTNPSTIDINAGTIDGTVIGGATTAAISGTTGQFSTSLNVDGTATMDGLVVDGASDLNGVAQIGGSTDLLYLSGKTGTHAYMSLGVSNTAADFIIGADTVIPLIFRTSATERMRIDSSGNVGINVTSPVSELHIDSATTSTTLTIESDVSPSLFTSGIDLIRSGTAKGSRIEALRDASAGGVGLNFLTTANNAAEISGTLTSRMVILETGEVGIGGTPDTKLAVSGGYISQTDGTRTMFLGSDGVGGLFGTTTDHYLRFVTNNTERMRIDASGNLLVGTTSQINAAKHNILGTSVTNVLGLKTEHGNYLITGFSSNTNTFIVQASGNVLNQNNSYGALSDERLKSNVVDAASQLDDIMAVQVRSYTLNSTGETHIGVVAQELESSGMSGLVAEDKEGMKSVKYSVLYMKAVKAIQEQQTLIESLTTRIEALEE